MTGNGDGTVLVVLAGREGAEAALRHAAQAAAALAHPLIIALHVRVDPMSTILPTEEMLSEDQRREMELEAAREGAVLHELYETWSRHLGRGLLADWRDVAGTEAEQVQQHAAGADLLVMAAPTEETRGHALQAFHAALFDAGRPLLAVPIAAREPGPVRRVLVGWKDSEGSRRAVRAAAPWLRRADDVQAVRVGEADGSELAMAEQVLADLGVRGTVRAVAENGLTDGERLLAEAEAMCADWLVMGAYRHSRLIEWVLGGVTRTVLHHARLPGFLVH